MLLLYYFTHTPFSHTGHPLPSAEGVIAKVPRTTERYLIAGQES
jgi:hypothetical protein